MSHTKVVGAQGEDPNSIGWLKKAQALWIQERKDLNARIDALEKERVRLHGELIDARVKLDAKLDESPLILNYEFFDEPTARLARVFIDDALERGGMTCGRRITVES